MNTNESYLKIIENYGPIIIIITTIFNLFSKQNYLFYYIIGLAINTILNFTLKIIIKEKRPTLFYKEYKLSETATDILKKNDYLIPIDAYGMPSGHAQNLGFSLGFMFLFIKKSYLLWIYIFISLITIFERYINHKHSIIQLLIGFFIGIIIGFLFYKIANHSIKGNMSIKKEDNAFLF
jgi:membrane-associated phospholipid phosphatase